MNIIQLYNRTYEELCHDSRVLRTARELKACGHNMTIVLFDSDGLEKSFDMDGIHIRSVRTVLKILPNRINPRLKKKSQFLVFRALRHMLKPVIYPLSWYKLMKTLAQEHYDVYWANDFETLPEAARLKHFTGSLTVYDSHEYWSGRMDVRGRWYFPLRLWSRLYEKYLIKHKVDIVVSVNHEILSMLAHKNVPSLCLYNIPSKHDIQPFTGYFHKLYGLSEEKRVLIFQGGLQKGRGIEFILASAQLFPPQWVVIFMGSGPLELMIHNMSGGVSKGHIFLHKPVPSQELLNYTAASDLGLCTIESFCLSYQFALPNKFWEYIQAGIPVVSTRLPSMSAIHQRFSIGEEFDEGNTESFIKVIHQIFNNYESYKESITQAQKEFDYERTITETYRKISDILTQQKTYGQKKR
jgi:starch synthase